MVDNLFVLRTSYFPMCVLWSDIFLPDLSPEDSMINPWHKEMKSAACKSSIAMLALHLPCLDEKNQTNIKVANL